MAAEAEAAREARAKVIAAEGEQKASRALREASEVIGDSPAALQLRYLQASTHSYLCMNILCFTESRLFTYGPFAKEMIVILLSLKNAFLVYI